MTQNKLVEALEPHIGKLRRCIPTNSSMGRVVVGQVEAMWEIVRIFDDATTTVATAATDARAVVEACTKVAESYISGGLKPAIGWTDDQVRWWEFGVTDAAAAIRSALRAKASEIIAALPQAGEVGPVAKRIDAKLREIFPDWESDQREAISIELAQAASPPSSVIPAAAEDETPCPVCGNEERGQGGYLSCQCPAVSIPAAAVGECDVCGGSGKNTASQLWPDYPPPCRVCGGKGALPTPSEGLTERYREVFTRIIEECEAGCWSNAADIARQQVASTPEKPV